ncbi:MAG: cell division protein ZapA [Paludibacteraceae bacterium]|nr:cell division protein ZapA [Paludibacteraceae bacterium]
MNDPFKITLSLLGAKRKLTIERSDEVLVREAAKALENRFLQYQNKYPSAAQDKQSLMLFTALDFAISSLRNQQALNGTADNLSSMLNEALDNNDMPASENDAD